MMVQMSPYFRRFGDDLQADGRNSTMTSSPSAVATRWRVVSVAPTPPDSSRSMAASGEGGFRGRDLVSQGSRPGPLQGDDCGLA